MRETRQVSYRVIADMAQRAPIARRQPEAVISAGRQYATIPALSLEKRNYPA
jgi:hypothetical protein